MDPSPPLCEAAHLLCLRSEVAALHGVLAEIQADQRVLLGLLHHLTQDQTTMSDEVSDLIDQVNTATNTIAAIVVDAAAKLDNNTHVISAVKAGVDALMTNLGQGPTFDRAGAIAELTQIRDHLAAANTQTAAVRDGLLTQGSNLTAIGASVINPVPVPAPPPTPPATTIPVAPPTPTPSPATSPGSSGAPPTVAG